MFNLLGMETPREDRYRTSRKGLCRVPVRWVLLVFSEGFDLILPRTPWDPDSDDLKCSVL